MGILIIILLPIMVWKMIDLAQQKDARLKNEILQQGKTPDPATVTASMPISFTYDMALDAGEQILETSAASNGLWFRIGEGGKTTRIILKDFTGKTIGRIKVTAHAPLPVN